MIKNALWKTLLIIWIAYFCAVPLLAYDIILFGITIFVPIIIQIILSTLYLIAGLKLPSSRIKYATIIIAAYIIVADIIFSAIYSHYLLPNTSSPNILQLLLGIVIGIIPSLLIFILLLINLYIIIHSR